MLHPARLLAKVIDMGPLLCTFVRLQLVLSVALATFPVAEGMRAVLQVADTEVGQFISARNDADAHVGLPNKAEAVSLDLVLSSGLIGLALDDAKSGHFLIAICASDTFFAGHSVPTLQQLFIRLQT
jgi:hypothetical protein